MDFFRLLSDWSETSWIQPIRVGGISDKSIPNAEPDNENVNRSIVLLGLRLSSGVDVFRIYHADWPNLDAKIIMLLHTPFLLRIYPDSSYQNQNCQVTGFFLSKNFCSRIFLSKQSFSFSIPTKLICAIYLYLAAFKESFDKVTVTVLLIHLVRQVGDRP